jgi:hypothetical protein
MHMSNCKSKYILYNVGIKSLISLGRCPISVYELNHMFIHVVDADSEYYKLQAPHSHSHAD